MSRSQSQPICGSSRTSSSGCSKVLAALNRRQPLKPPDESLCVCNWMQSARALPPPLARMLISFLMGPWLEKATSTAVKAGQEMMDHRTAFLLSTRFCSRPHPLSARRWKDTITFTFLWKNEGKWWQRSREKSGQVCCVPPSDGPIHHSVPQPHKPRAREMFTVETHVSFEEH